MLFRVKITTVEELTFERETLEKAAEYTDELQEKLQKEKHHGEEVSVSFPRRIR